MIEVIRETYKQRTDLLKAEGNLTRQIKGIQRRLLSSVANECGATVSWPKGISVKGDEKAVAEILAMDRWITRSIKEIEGRLSWQNDVKLGDATRANILVEIAEHQKLVKGNARKVRYYQAIAKRLKGRHRVRETFTDEQLDKLWEKSEES